MEKIKIREMVKQERSRWSGQRILGKNLTFLCDKQTSIEQKEEIVKLFREQDRKCDLLVLKNSAQRTVKLWIKQHFVSKNTEKHRERKKNFFDSLIIASSRGKKEKRRKSQKNLSCVPF